MLFHGTSLKQWLKIKASGYNVRSLYLGEDRENITDHYAEAQAKRDGSPPVTLVLDSSRLQLDQDVHILVDGEEVQEGQYTFSGNVKPALLAVLLYDEEAGEEEDILE